MIFFEMEERDYNNYFGYLLVFVIQSLSDWLFETPGLQQARIFCPPLSPRVCSYSHPLCQWCYLTILPSAAPFSFGLWSFPASGSFPMSQLFTLDGQSIGFSATVLPMNIHGWYPLGLMVWWFYCPRDSQESFPAPQFGNINSSAVSLFYGPTHIRDYWKNHSFDYTDLINYILWDGRDCNNYFRCLHSCI